MKNSAVRLLNVLIIISIVSALGIAAALAATAVRILPTVSVDQPSLSFTESEVRIDIPLSLSNPGPMPISDVSLMLSVKDGSDTTILSGSGGPFTVSAGRTEHLTFPLTLPLSDTSRPILSRLLTSSENLTVTATLLAYVPPLAKLTGRAFTDFPWGALVDNLQISTPSVAIYNSSHLLVTVPMSFENHSPFIDVDTVLEAEIINATTGLSAGAGSLHVQAARNSAFSQDLILYLGTPLSSETLFFNDATLNYIINLNATIIGVPTSASRTIQLAWGAPVKNLSFAPFSAQIVNSTHARISLPFSLENNSDYVALSGRILGVIHDSQGNEVGSIEPYALKADSGHSLSDQLTGFVRPDSLGQGVLVLRLTFETAYGSFLREVTVNA